MSSGRREQTGGQQKRSRVDEDYSPSRGTGRRRDKRGYDVDRNFRRRDPGGGYFPRRNDDCYGRGYREDQVQVPDDQWKCLECREWNHTRDNRCIGCGCPRSRRRDSIDDDVRQSSESLDDSAGGGGISNEEDLDEFGRSKARPSTPPRWPPVFESGGASYVFDTRCGMFYEALSDFFYDPKTKLYYGNKQQAYYTHNSAESPPFTEVTTSQNGSGEDDKEKGGSESIPAATKNGNEEKKTIVINLKSTVLPGKLKQSKGGRSDKKVAHVSKKEVSPTPSRATKEQAANMDKWSERGKEMRKQDDEMPKEPVHCQDSDKVPKTSSGQPICVLCKRKFPSLEKLRQHEKLSSLHKENMKKKEAESQSKQAADPSLAYRDRALERRAMHGPETTTSLPPLPRDLDTQRPETEFVRPEDNLGSNNIGNQMLQKLGWKSGASLGRKAEDASAESSAERTIVKDWERIESLASSGHGSRSFPGSGNGGGIGRPF